MGNIVKQRRIFSETTNNSGSSGVTSVNSGVDITIDNTDPANPIVNFTGTFQDPITVVANYSALPSVSTVSGKFYWCSSSHGTRWLPGSIGGTYYNSGLYYSNGVSWEYLDVPYNATQSTVDIGTNNDQFITANTFTNASKWNTKQDTLTIGSLTDAGTDGIIITNGTSSIIGTGTSIAQHVSDTSHNGYLSSTDWNTFNLKEPAITVGTTLQYWRGDKTFQTLNTATVSELTNLYYTNARGIGSALTGYSSSAGTVVSTDTILQAIQKLNGNTTALVTGVSSVNSLTGSVALTGTSNRVTISAANIFDISSTFEALLGKVANPLSQFASTTSAQLRGVLSDENGTGVALFDSSTSATFITPLLGTPTSGILTNCTGYTGSNLVLIDVTTNNSSTANHGFLKKLDNVATDYMDGTGNWSVPQGVQGNLTGAITSVGLATSLGSFSSANLATALTDETGTGVAVFGTTPTFTTNITTPLILGGIVAGSFIKYQSTIGTGTTTGIAHEYWGGTNGGTNLFNVYNDAQFLVNTTTRNSTSLGTFRVGQGTSTIDIGEVSSGKAAIFMNVTPSLTNYTVANSGTGGTLNGSATADIRVLNVVKMNFGPSTVVISPGASSGGSSAGLTYTAAANTGQTAGSEAINVNYDLTATLQHASNTVITTQRAFVIQAPTYSFVSSGGAITTAATLAISGAPIQGTNWNSGTPKLYSIWAQAGLARFDGGISGVTDASSAAAGIVGETMTSTISTYTNYTTTATYQNITSIALTPGDWQITAFGTFNSNTATITAASNCIFVVSTTTASAAGSTEGLNISYIPQAALIGTSKESAGSITYNVSINANTTYYLNSQATFTLGNPQYVGTIQARRLR